MDTQKIIIVIAFIAFVVVSFVIKETVNKRKGESGEDMEKVRRVVAKLLPDSSSYTIVYTYYIDNKYVGNNRTSCYYHYAVAFKPGKLFVAPISYNDGEVGHKNGTLMTKENLGRIQLKGGSPILFDKAGKELCTLHVIASNTRQSKYEPFNIQQKEQADAFNAFIKAFANEVNRAHS